MADLAQLVVVRDPFHPSAHREQHAVAPGQTLADLAPKSGVFILLRNGEAVLRQDWHLPIGDNDLVSVVFLPRGGGGGGSNPLKIVLSIALTIMIPQLGITSWLGDAIFMNTSLGLVASSALAQAAISCVGKTEINPLGVTHVIT